MNRLISIVVFVLSVCAISSAQDNGGNRRTLVGVVKDTQGKGLPGAVVYVKDSPTIGTSTDKYGNFELKKIPEGNQTIIFSMLGMTEVEILYTGQESTIVTLEEEASTMKM